MVWKISYFTRLCELITQAFGKIKRKILQTFDKHLQAESEQVSEELAVSVYLRKNQTKNTKLYCKRNKNHKNAFLA